jgi:pilus assembly protein CpaB
MKLTFPKKLRPSKTWIVLGVALGVGLLAALVAQRYLSNQMARIEAAGKGNTVNLVVAKVDLKEGTSLSSANLAVRAIPADWAQSTAVAPGEFDRIDGRVLNTSLKAGEMVLWSQVKDRQPPAFSTRIAPGHRAITLAIDEINSISGMLEPGDQIDLMVALDQKGRKAIVPLLLGVTVMATGQRSVDDPKSGERREYSTVTLDTDPQEARNLIAARELGRITALLRNRQEPAPARRAGVDLASLMTQREVAAGNGEGGVPVLYGGGRLAEQDTALARRNRPATTEATNGNPAGRP